MSGDDVSQLMQQRQNVAKELQGTTSAAKTIAKYALIGTVAAAVIIPAGLVVAGFGVTGGIVVCAALLGSGIGIGTGYASATKKPKES